MQAVAATIQDELHTHYLFAALAQEQYAAVLTHTRVHAFVAGQRIFNQGDAAATIFLVRQGAIKLYRVSVLQESFAACRNVMQQMTRRIQNHWDEIEALTLQNSRYRVIHYLLGLVPSGTRGAACITLPARKALIATQLAVAPETLSRILNGLSEEGLADTHHYTVRIPDVAALQRV